MSSMDGPKQEFCLNCNIAFETTMHFRPKRRLRDLSNASSFYLRQVLPWLQKRFPAFRDIDPYFTRRRSIPNDVCVSYPTRRTKTVHINSSYMRTYLPLRKGDPWNSLYIRLHLTWRWASGFQPLSDVRMTPALPMSYFARCSPITSRSSVENILPQPVIPTQSFMVNDFSVLRDHALRLFRDSPAWDNCIPRKIRIYSTQSQWSKQLWNFLLRCVHSAVESREFGFPQHATNTTLLDQIYWLLCAPKVSLKCLESAINRWAFILSEL